MSEARQKLAPNKRRVLEAWERLSGNGSNPTTREIAKEAGMNINGVSQMLAECGDKLGMVPVGPVVHGSTQKWRAAV